MKENLKNEKGITLVSLVITIIVLMILAAVSIGAADGIKGNIQTVEDDVAISELSQVQQAVLETYIKYKQTGNETYLVGTGLTYSQAKAYLKELDINLNVKQEAYDLPNAAKEKTYYQLSKSDLEAIGISNTENVYIVNYETGEVFNYTCKVTGEGEILYIYAE